MSRDFSRRSTEAELMDDPTTDYITFEGCLHDLAQVNVVTLAHGATIGFLERLHREGRLDRGRPVEILDVGSGQGDLLRRVARWADRKGASVRLVGVDLSPWSARAAAEAWRGSPAPEWVTEDVFDYRGSPDVVVSSLFTHHLPDAAIVRFLAWMEATAGTGWFINDLHRHPLPYYGFGVLARLMRWHRFVQHDGPVSIARAFSVADWRGYLRAAELDDARVDVRWRFPFRICLARVKDAA
jgi:2-polyprenyl-3-methyl-5-hydroxy-6-metoxy-1,4-benzoquinol methylase